jgi:hypothetical protein
MFKVQCHAGEPIGAAKAAQRQPKGMIVRRPTTVVRLLLLLICLGALRVIFELRVVFDIAEAPLRPRALQSNVTVSLTTVASRSGILARTLRTLLQQTLLPRSILVCVEDPAYTTVAVQRVLDEAADGLQWNPVRMTILRGAAEYGPASKVLYALQRSWESAGGIAAQDLIAFVDDDVLYPADWLETLMHYHSRFPTAALGFRGWRINPDYSWGVKRSASIPFALSESQRYIITSSMIAEPYR